MFHDGPVLIWISFLEKFRRIYRSICMRKSVSKEIVLLLNQAVCQFLWELGIAPLLGIICPEASPTCCNTIISGNLSAMLCHHGVHGINPVSFAHDPEKVVASFIFLHSADKSVFCGKCVKKVPVKIILLQKKYQTNNKKLLICFETYFLERKKLKINNNTVQMLQKNCNLLQNI